MGCCKNWPEFKIFHEKVIKELELGVRVVSHDGYIGKSSHVQKCSLQYWLILWMKHMPCSRGCRGSMRLWILVSRGFRSLIKFTTVIQDNMAKFLGSCCSCAAPSEKCGPPCQCPLKSSFLKWWFIWQMTTFMTNKLRCMFPSTSITKHTISHNSSSTHHSQIEWWCINLYGKNESWHESKVLIIFPSSDALRILLSITHPLHLDRRFQSQQGCGDHPHDN